MDELNTQTLVAEKQITINRDYWNSYADRVFTPQLIQIIDLLHELFANDRLHLLEQREKNFKLAFKDLNNFEKTLPGFIIDSDWHSKNNLHQAKNVKTFLACSPDNSNVLSKLFSNTEKNLAVDAVMLDFEDAFKPMLTNYIKAMSNINDIATEHSKFAQKTQSYFGFSHLTEQLQQPSLILKVRGLHCSDKSFLFGNTHASASIVDVVQAVYTSVKYFIPKNKGLVICIPKCYDYNEASWWHHMINELEDLFGLDKGTVKIIFEVAHTRAAMEMEHCLFELRERAIGVILNFRSKFFDDMRHHIKKGSGILPVRNAVSVEKDFNDFCDGIISVAKSHNLFVWSGLGFNVTGNLYAASEDVEVASYESELELLAQKNFDALQITHSVYAEKVHNILSLKNNVEISDVHVNLKSLFEYNATPVTVADLRDYLRTAIEYTHAWEQGIASAFFGNRYEDITSFDMMRAQIRQWIVNGVETETGDKINSRYVTMILLEELDKLKTHLEEEFDGNPTAEMRTILNTYTQATLKLEQILHDEKIPDYFNAGINV